MNTHEQQVGPTGRDRLSGQRQAERQVEQTDRDKGQTDSLKTMSQTDRLQTGAGQGLDRLQKQAGTD